MLNLSNCHRNSNLDSKKLVFYFFYLLDCACVLSHFSHVCLCDPMDPRLLCLSVKVEIWVNVEKFFKNIRWNETMCKIVHKIWASFFFLSFFFFLQINTILVTVLEKNGREWDQWVEGKTHILLLEFSPYTVTGFTIRVWGEKAHTNTQM